MITTARMALLVLVLFLTVDGNGGETEIRRCLDPQGNISFQFHRCEFSGEQLKIQTVTHGWTSPRPGEKRLLAHYQAQEAQRRERVRVARKKARMEAKTETKSCFSRRKSLERVETKLRRGYTAAEGMRLRAQREEYEEYLYQFCS